MRAPGDPGGFVVCGKLAAVRFEQVREDVETFARSVSEDLVTGVTGVVSCAAAIETSPSVASRFPSAEQ